MANKEWILTLLDQFPGPTVEARSGDTLKIEVSNLAEVDLTLHWHGLHMRGNYECGLVKKSVRLTFNRRQ